MKKLIFGLALMFLITSAALAQEFRATVNRDTVPEGETFLLSLDLTGASTNETPDLAELGKDFTIYSVANAYRTNIVNNTMEQSRQWNLVLMPKHSGEITIPAIKLDNFSTQPVTIKVVKAGEQISPQAPGQSGEPRFKISGEVDNRSPYVQQQVNYTLTLYDTGGLQGEEPMFMTTGNSDWIIRSLGEPQISTQVINGRTIREIKFQYALFPQKSGELTVPAVKFNGFYLTKNNRRDPFSEVFGDDMFIAGFGLTDVFATRNPVVLTTEPIKINVLPAAAANNGNWWLPASKIELLAQFEPANPVFKAGEAVSRTIYLRAGGVVDTQLPEIRFPETAGLKQYPEKPQTQMKVENGKVISLEKIVNTYIPQQAGELTLPAISVNWFNINSGKMEQATLPAQKIRVLPGAGKSAPAAAAPSAATKINEPRAGASPETPVSAASSPSAQSTNINIDKIEKITPFYIYLLLGTAFAAGIFVSWLIMRVWSRRGNNKPGNYKKAVLNAAEAKDLRALRDDLLGWASERWQRDDVTSLKEVADLAQSPEFGNELEKLTEALYARSSKEWNPESFIKTFQKVNKMKIRTTNDDNPLPKLYKN